MPSMETRFMFTTGLLESMTVPAGTLKGAQGHVRHVEDTLGLEVMGTPPSLSLWRTTKPGKDVSDETLCRIAADHNDWVDYFWRMLSEWHECPPKGDTETLTPEDAATFWHGLRQIDVPMERWDRHYYRRMMGQVYEILRGRQVTGVHWTHKPLTPDQAGGVLWLIEQHLGLDVDDQRLEVPRAWRVVNGRTKLVQLDEVQPSGSYDGDGYQWCERCGAVADDGYGETGCPRSRSKCPIKRDRAS